MSLALRLLCVWNVLCPLAFGLVFLTWDQVGVGAFGRRAADIVGFVSSWAWLGTTPFTTALALICNRRVGSGAVRWIALTVLLVWLAFVTVVIVVPLGA